MKHATDPARPVVYTHPVPARAARRGLGAVALACAAVGVALTACNNAPPREDGHKAPGQSDGGRPDPTALGDPVALADALPGLHNVFAIDPTVYSGSGPDTPEAFDSLAAFDVKTIISVDGARPNLELAHERGMRYIHIPIGYDGMSERERFDLAKAVRDSDGPIYIHCHHGKHRGPAAAAVAMVGLGRMTHAQAETYLHAAGTSESYPGLWAAMREMEHATDAEIDAAYTVLCDAFQFPEYQPVSGLVDGMVAIDTTWANIKVIRGAEWKTPRDHPDLAPAAETGILADHFRALLDDPDAQAEGAEFVEALRHTAERASALEASLTRIARDPAFIEQAYQSVAASCNDCHKQWRD